MPDLLPQDLQVTEVEVADSRFAVPPPRDVAVATPDAAAPDVAVRPREIELATREAPVVPTVRTPPGVRLSAPRVSPRGVAVVEREVELAETRAPTVASTRQPAPFSTPDIRAPAPSAQARRSRCRPRGSRRRPPTTAPRRPGSRGRGTGARFVGTQRAGTAARGFAARGRPEPAVVHVPRGPPAGAGRQPGQHLGAAALASVSDDWGDSTREVPGGQAGTPGASGLFNADGSPRLAGDGRVGGGLPPGTITEDFENIDRHGTWLKRPPYDYEPTAFDRFWMPSETLLEEWVRKSVTEVRIPIPGTTKSIRCMTVLLAMGAPAASSIRTAGAGRRGAAAAGRAVQARAAGGPGQPRLAAGLLSPGSRKPAQGGLPSAARWRCGQLMLCTPLRSRICAGREEKYAARSAICWSSRSRAWFDISAWSRAPLR